MGHVYVDADVSWSREERVRFLVDTGATYAIIPADIAARLGLPISPAPKQVTLADGTRRSLHFTTAWVRVGDREAAATAFVVPAGVDPLLGVEALEALGLAVDPASGTLHPTRSRAVLAVGFRHDRG